MNEENIGMDGETVWPNWDCPQCDAPNAGVECCDPGSNTSVLCDECGAEMVYRNDWN